MRHALLSTLTAFFLLLPAAAGAEAPPGPAPGGETRPAPLVVAAGGGPRVEFQIGADAFGGGLAGVDFIGGVNVCFTYPVLDWLQLGLRPALHYTFVDDRAYDETWMHADVALQFNLLQQPLRLYLLAAGGYAFAVDPDLYQGAAHGWSALGGAGVAWRPEGSTVGLFAELGFRYGAAGRDVEQLLRDERGQPIYEPGTLTWQTEQVERSYELLAFTVNIGLTISP